MSFNIPRIVISAFSGGSGKTVLSVGLARAFARRGLRVQAFKKGPDHIDTLWASLAGGLKPRNLDPFMIPPGTLPHLFEKACFSCSPLPDLAIVEGNRGLFDGLDLQGSCSTAELSRQLSAPVILSVNCTKMTRTAAALLQGCKNFEPGTDIAGVILNQATRGRHRAIVREAVETMAGIPVLGAVPRLPAPPFEERRDGLLGGEAVLAGAGAFGRLDALAGLIEEHVDLDAVLEIARSAPPLEALIKLPETSGIAFGAGKPRIGYVRDQALWFYYTENLDALENAGAELVELSLLDAEPWPELDGLYLGGGVPEDYLRALSANTAKMRLLACLVERGLPVYAEGGALYCLGREVVRDGVSYPMSGVFDFSVKLGSTPQGLGYVQGTVKSPNPFHPVGSRIKAHEFHYAVLTADPGLFDSALLALDKGVGLGSCGSAAGRDGLLKGNCHASQFQIFSPGVPWWAENFVRIAAKAKKRRQN